MPGLPTSVRVGSGLAVRVAHGLLPETGVALAERAVAVISGFGVLDLRPDGTKVGATTGP